MWSFNFITRTPGFECNDDIVRTGNVTDVSNVTGFFDSKQDSQCFIRTNAASVVNSTEDMTPCYEFSYSTTLPFSIVTEFDLVCSRKWLISLGYWIFSFANFFSFIPTGILADKYGRRPMIITGLSMALIGSLMLTLANSITEFYIVWFFLGISYVFIFSPGHCYFMEHLGAELRLANNLMYVSYGSGFIVLAGISWLITEWRNIFLVATIPFQLLHLVIVIRFTQAFVNKGFDILITQFEGSFHLNMCLYGFVRVGYAFFGAFIIKYFKRKTAIFTSCLIMTISFFSTAILSVTQYQNQWLEMTLSLIGVVCVLLIGNVLSYYSVEVFPTRARVTMQGSIKAFSRIGQMVSAFTDLLGRIYGRYIVDVVFGILSLLALFVSILLPETKDCELPDTLEESKGIANRKEKKKKENKILEEDKDSLLLTAKLHSKQEITETI